MNRPRLWLLLGLTVVHFVVGWWWASRTAVTRQLEQRGHLEHLLSEMLGDLDLIAGYRHLLSRVLPDWFGRPPPGPGRLPARLAAQLPGLHAGLVSLTMLDASGTVLWQTPLASAPFPQLLALSQDRELERFRVVRPPTRDLLLREYPAWPGLRAGPPPGTPAAAPGTVDHLMLVIDLQRLPSDFLLRRNVRRWRHQGWAVGFLHRLDPARDLLPPGLDRRRAEPLAHQAAQTGEPLRLADGSLVVVLTTAGPHVLLGQVPPPSPTLPVGVLAAWLLTASLALVMPAPGGWPRPALAAFLIASLGVAAGLPILVTALFWMRFTTTLTASAEAEELARLGEALVQIDNRFPILLRRRQREFCALLREFERTQALGPLLDRLAIMELGCEFDNGFLVSSAGAMLRHYSRIATYYRPFALLPKDRRRQALQDQLNAGRRPQSGEVELMLDIDLATASLLRTWRFHPKETAPVSQLMGNMGKMLLRTYNQEILGLSPAAPDQPEDPASMLYDGLFESSAADLKSQLLANLGTFVRAGSRPNIVHIYFDILRDALGYGAYALYLVQHTIGAEMAFLRDLFRGAPLVDEGVRFYAQSAVVGFTFPPGERPPLLASWANRLEPPRLLRGEVATLDGERVLVAAFACRHLPNYRLFAVRPYAPLADRLHQTKVLMGSGLLLVFLLVGTIGWRLREGVLRPARALLAGIQAMETRAFDHRITVATGDEWDDLAAAFNQTLATMEELEVASIIQARLFPAGPVTTPGGTFLGRSRTTQEVGGDYFDALPGPDGTLFFLMGDVTGHGVSAALVVAMAKSAFGYLVRTGPPSPAAILDRMSALFREQLGRTLGMTCQIGCLSPDGALRFANAGHLFPFLLQPGQPVRRLEQPSVPLGMRARRPYVDLVIDLPRDARLLLCTDGIIEATDPAGRMFGFSRLTALLTALPPAPPAATIEAVFAALAAHTQGVPWADDVTVAILCRSAGETA